MIGGDYSCSQLGNEKKIEFCWTEKPSVIARKRASHRGRSPVEEFLLVELIECLAQIRNQIGGVFNSKRQPDHVV